MPELAEVEYFRKQWEKGMRQKILGVQLHAEKRIFRGTDVAALQKSLRGSLLTGSEAHGKQLMFRFSKDGWLGIHLGMSGKLRTEPAAMTPLKHDHLVLRQAKQCLVFSDPRLFGRVLFHQGTTKPDWWENRPAEILSPQFTLRLVQAFLRRHARSPVKATLLSQAGFPGVGNWMADEILWQAKIHPARPSGSLSTAEVKALRTKTQSVCRLALRTIGMDHGDGPKTWLIQQRWKKNGVCPLDGSRLSRREIGGRTTCWCPSCQKERKGLK
jgi:formamidopyrimidine-DNA glycosylase